MAKHRKEDQQEISTAVKIARAPFVAAHYAVHTIATATVATVQVTETVIRWAVRTTWNGIKWLGRKIWAGIKVPFRAMKKAIIRKGDEIFGVEPVVIDDPKVDAAVINIADKIAAKMNLTEVKVGTITDTKDDGGITVQTTDNAGEPVTIDLIPVEREVTEAEINEAAEKLGDALAKGFLDPAVQAEAEKYEKAFLDEAYRAEAGKPVESAPIVIDAKVRKPKRSWTFFGRIRRSARVLFGTPATA